jgi:hypothetical protein
MKAKVPSGEIETPTGYENLELVPIPFVTPGVTCPAKIDTEDVEVIIFLIIQLKVSDTRI